MARTDNIEIAFLTFVQITFDRNVHVKGVRVVGAIDEPAQGYPTVVEWFTNNTGYVACGASLTATCDTAICDAYAAVVAVSRTEDYQYLSLGAIIVFECTITEFVATNPGDIIYELGTSAITWYSPSLTADCTTAEYIAEITYVLTVFDSGN